MSLPFFSKAQCLDNNGDEVHAYYNLVVWCTQSFMDDPEFNNNTDAALDFVKDRITTTLSSFNGAIAYSNLELRVFFIPRTPPFAAPVTDPFDNWAQTVNVAFKTRWPHLKYDAILVFDNTGASGHGAGKVALVRKFSDDAFISHELGHLIGLEHTDGSPCHALCDSEATANFMCQYQNGGIFLTSCNVGELEDYFDQPNICDLLLDYIPYLPEDYEESSLPKLVSVETDQLYLTTDVCTNTSTTVNYKMTVIGGTSDAVGVRVRARYDRRSYDFDIPTQGMDFNGKTHETAYPETYSLTINDAAGIETPITVLANEMKVFHFQLTYNPDTGFPVNDLHVRVIGTMEFNNNVAALSSKQLFYRKKTGALSFLESGVPCIFTGDVTLNGNGNDFNINSPSILVKKGNTITIGASTNATSVTNIKTTVQGCDGMWTGIKITDGSSLKLDGTTLADAQKAIQVQKGVKLDVKNTRFMNNNYGIATAGGGSGDFDISLSNNRFEFNAAQFKTAYGGQSPAPAGKSFVGITLSNVVTGLSLGGYHYFSNLKYGIIAYNSSVNISGAHFENMPEVPVGSAYGVSLPSGTAIYARGGTLTATDNMMVACGSGIRGYNNSVVIEDNFIQSADHGIVYGGALNTTVNIKRNTVDAKMNGIKLTAYSASTKVEENTVTISGNPDAMKNGKTGMLIGPSQRVNVGSNTILVSNPTENKFGIKVEGGENNSIACNIVIGTGTATDGIHATHNGRVSYLCNVTNGTGTGLHFEGMSVGKNAALVAGNAMKDNRIGLFLGNGAVIGSQEHNGNRWLGSFSLIGAQNNGDLFSSQFTVDAAENTAFMPPSSFQQGWFLNNAEISTSFQCNLPSTTCPPVVVYSTPKLSEYKRTAKGQFSSGPYSGVNNWIARKRLYERVQLEGNPFPNDADINLFLSNAHTNGIAAYANLRTNIKQAFAIPETDLNTLRQKDAILAQSLAALRTVETAFHVRGISHADSIALQSQRTALRTTIRQATNSRKNLLNSFTTARLTSVSALSAQNTALSAPTLWEQNEKTVNEIFLSTFAQEIYTLTVQQAAILNAIALQCPLAGGEAVFEAREMLALLDDAPANYPDNCPSVAQTTEDRHDFENNASVLCLPNPASEKITVDYEQLPLSTENKLSLYNTLGEKIFGMVLPDQSGQIEIPVRDLSNGIYFYNLQSLNAVIFSGRVIIQH